MCLRQRFSAQSVAETGGADAVVAVVAPSSVAAVVVGTHPPESPVTLALA